MKHRERELALPKRILLPIVIVLIAIAIFTGLKQSKPEKTVIQKPEKIWRVNTVPVKFQQISPEITLYGRIETPRKSTLKSALSADVVSIAVLEGSEVELGQSLIQLDDTDVQLLLEQRQADLAEVNALIDSESERFKRDEGLLEQETQLLTLADKAVVRAKKLEQSRLASQSSLDDSLASKQRQVLTLKRLKFDIAEHPARVAQLNARKKRAKALLQQAEVNLGRSNIIAPFSGRLSQLNVAVGDRLRAGDSLLSLYDLENLEVRAQIPGRYISQVHQMLNQGESLLATASVDKQALSFELERLSGEVRLDSGGIDGLFSIVTKTQSLALGTFVELKLSLAQQDKVVALPFNALYGLNHVYRLNGGYLESIQIERIGEYTNEIGEKQLLLRGDELSQGDQIVSTQLPNAITGLRVEAMSE